jgi:RecA/RadA recombinase
MNICVTDNVEFESKRSDAKFCSAKCQKAYARNKQNENVQAPEPETPKPEPKPAKSQKSTKPSFEKTFWEEFKKEQVERRGYSSVYLASEAPVFETISTNCKEIDELLLDPNGNPGGYPVGALTEIYGPAGAGKTSLMIRLTNGLTRQGKRVLYIDSEKGVNPAFFKDKELVRYVTEQSMSVIQEGCITVLKNKMYDAIIIDSIAGLVPDAIQEAQGHHVGLKPKKMGEWIARMMSPLMGTETVFIFVNQERETMGQMFNKKYSPGGTAYHHALTLQLRFAKGKKLERTIDGVKQVYGHELNVLAEKTRISMPGARTTMKLVYDNNYDNDDNL